MKKKRRLLTTLLMMLCLVFGVLAAPGGVQARTVRVTGTYHQSEARRMLKKVNRFRTGKKAWYYAPSGSKVRVDGLGELSYDYTLERIAMLRAAEISKSFSHTRPNGQSCFSLMEDLDYMALGENIAAGYPTMASVFKGWQETDQPYAGQGHRRNMLSERFTCIGIACFEVNGVRYWVQELGAPTLDARRTKAVNKSKKVKVEI